MQSLNIKKVFFSLFSSIKFLFLQINKKRDYVFYSESHNYKQHYIELLNNLTKKSFFTSVITSDLDEYHDLKKNNFDAYYIGQGLLRTIIFNFISCKYMIMTMTDIGNNINKSLFCENYVYYFHCPHSTHKIYTPKAFDNFDIVLCVGSFQINEIRKNETINNLPKKKLFKIGYFYLDYLYKNSNNSLQKKNRILFAPSWNYDEDNLFNKFGQSIILDLINNNFEVIFRPHPEILKRNFIEFNIILNRFKNNKKFILDTSFSNIRSMEDASLIITDNSAIAIEFSLTFYRPIIYINYKNKIHNKKYYKIKETTLEDDFKKKIGVNISIDSINRLSSICRDEIESNKIDIKKIENFKYRHFANFLKTTDKATEILTKNNIN
jgi:hypothetical protein